MRLKFAIFSKKSVDWRGNARTLQDKVPPKKYKRSQKSAIWNSFYLNNRKSKFQGFNQTEKIKNFFAFLHNWAILKSLKIFNGLPPKGLVTHPTKNLGLNRIYQIVQIASVCLSYRHDCVLPPAVSPNLRL